MERQIGEIFDYKDKKLQVIKQNGCEGCYFQNKFCYGDIYDEIGECIDRDDQKEVIFKEV